jgi:release factor glutamine methyltransferase
MDAIGTIIKEAKFYLQPGGWILLEHGYQQAELVQKCFLENHFTEVKTKQDLSGHPRVTIAKNN